MDIREADCLNVLRNYESDLAFWYATERIDMDIYYKTCQMINKIFAILDTPPGNNE